MVIEAALGHIEAFGNATDRRAAIAALVDRHRSGPQKRFVLPGLFIIRRAPIADELLGIEQSARRGQTVSEDIEQAILDP